jgi:single-strand DNA-binding protein
MASVNIVMLMGNLTRDVEMRYTPSGMAVAKIGLATNRKFRDTKTNELREEVTYVDITAFGKTAELCGQYLSKGRPVFIEGRLKFDQWDDKQTGQKRSKLAVVADRVQFMGGGGGPGGGGQGGGQGGGAARPAKPARQAPPQPDQDMGGDGPPEDLDIQEESVPF